MMSQYSRPARTAARTLSLATIVLAVSGATADAASLATGELRWTMVNVFDTSAPANTDRTWMGYVTNPTPFSGSQGTVSPIAPAVGPTVTKTSPRGADQLHTYELPAARGTYEPADGSGTVELAGAVQFFSPAPAPAAGHDFTLTVEQPTLVLSGERGALYASGRKGSTAGGARYDRDRPLFDLDLSDASVTLHPDGSRTIGPITPALATADHAFPSNYAVGAGPDRTPNTFGSFAVTLRLDPGSTNQGPAGADGPSGPAGATGPLGPAGPAGAAAPTTRSSRVSGSSIARVILARAPFGRRAVRQVRITRPGSKHVLAVGTVRGRTLRYTRVVAAQTGRRIAGMVLLRPVDRRARPARVRLG